MKDLINAMYKIAHEIGQLIHAVNGNTAVMKDQIEAIRYVATRIH